MYNTIVPIQLIRKMFISFFFFHSQACLIGSSFRFSHSILHPPVPLNKMQYIKCIGFVNIAHLHLPVPSIQNSGTGTAYSHCPRIQITQFLLPKFTRTASSIAPATVFIFPRCRIRGVLCNTVFLHHTPAKADAHLSDSGMKTGEGMWLAG